MRLLSAARVLAVLFVLTAFCRPAHATIHQITVGNNFFSPLGTTVEPGDTVRWVWVGGAPHSSTADDTSPKQWNSPTTSSAGFQFDVQFTAEDGAGPFPYHCAVHFLTMKDTIFVTVPSPCCSGRVGDANGMGGDEPTLGDIGVLIDALFLSASPEPLTCIEEADVNQSGGASPTFDDISLGDISVLIDYLFLTGPELGLNDCP